MPIESHDGVLEKKEEIHWFTWPLSGYIQHLEKNCCNLTFVEPKHLQPDFYLILEC